MHNNYIYCLYCITRLSLLLSLSFKIMWQTHFSCYRNKHCVTWLDLTCLDLTCLDLPVSGILDEREGGGGCSPVTEVPCHTGTLSSVQPMRGYIPGFPSGDRQRKKNWALVSAGKGSDERPTSTQCFYWQRFVTLVVWGKKERKKKKKKKEKNKNF